MTSPHAAYEKMAESLAELELDEAGLRALRRTEWVVSEKIHGANFALVAELPAAGAGTISFRAAKRKAFLEPGEDFFGHHALLERIEPAVRAAFEGAITLLGPKLGVPARVTIFGELFGGAYPHPSVPPCPGAQPVQTGIHYSPRIELCAFDLAIDAPDGARTYLDHDTALSVFRSAGLFHAEPLFIGSYEDAMAWPLGFDSTVPARLGLPPLGSPNPAEGVVVKPVKGIIVRTRRGDMRPVLKRKIPRFAEDRRFHEATKWAAEPAGQPALSRLEWEMLALVTENRLAAAISKVGRITRMEESRAREVLRLFEEEVWAGLREAQPAALGSLPAEERELLRSVLADEARRLLESVVSRP